MGILNLSKNSVVEGIGLAVLAHACAIVLILLATMVGAGLGQPQLRELPIMALVVCGLVQLVYLVPLALWQAKKGRGETAKGIWLSIALLFLVNATCWGMVAGAF